MTEEMGTTLFQTLKNNGQDVQCRLAEYFICTQTGARILNVRQIANALEVSVGAVSTAMNSLETYGAIGIVKRGHMGSYLVERRMDLLWRMAGRGPMVVALSLPIHTRFEGLASGVKKNLEDAGMEAYLSFIRGSQTRLRALRDSRCHLVLMSDLSAKDLDFDEYEIVCALPEGSWLSGYGVFTNTGRKNPDAPLRVGVDPKSHDHIMLTQMNFEGRDIEICNVSYSNVTRMILMGEIDAIVWNQDQLAELTGSGISFEPLSPAVGDPVIRSAKTAVFVGRRDDLVVGSAFRELICSETIMEIQKQVVALERLPEY